MRQNQSTCPLTLFLVLVLALTTTVFALPKTQSKNEEKHDSPVSKSGRHVADNKYTIDWAFDTPGFVIFTLRTNSIFGYCAVGISGIDQATMRGADMAFVRFDNGQCSLADSYGTGPIPPSTDSQNDLSLKSCEYSAGMYTVIFSRPLNTGDSNAGQDVVLEPGTTKTCIWSYGENAGANSHTPTSRGSFFIDIP